MFALDLSSHNYPKCLEYLKDPQIIMLKATEGVTFVDPRLKDYVKHIGEYYRTTKVIPYMAYYHFARMDNVSKGNTPEKEADNFYNAVKEYLPAVLVLDIEGESEAYSNPEKWIAAFDKRLRDRMKKDGKPYEGGKLIIYTNAACSKRKNFADVNRPWWVADYGTQTYPRTTKNWVAWQMHSKQMQMDMSYVKLTEAEWMSYAVGNR